MAGGHLTYLDRPSPRRFLLLLAFHESRILFGKTVPLPALP